MFPTKIQPPRPNGGVLRRRRLVDRIHEHLDRRLTLISAPAGYGKTTLLADFASEATFPVCWLALDHTDRDLLVFAEHLVAALRRHFPDLGEGLHQALGARDLTAAAVASALVAEIEAKTHAFFAIVLDDYHELDDSEPVNEVVDLLLTYLPEQCRVVVASRTIPGHLRLSRLAAQTEVAGVGGAELAFTVDEVAGLLRARGHDHVTDEQAQRWHAASHGWAAALVLSTEADAPSGAEKITSPRQLLAFLSDEVLGRLPGHLQQFLLHTSVLNPVTAVGADALLGTTNAERLLAELSNHQLLVQRSDGAPATYAYHPLVREYLVTRLRAEEPAAFAELSGRAGRFAEAAELLDAAVEHYLQGGLFTEVVGLLRTHSQDLLNQGRWEALRAWFDALPQRYWADDPHLLMLLARVLQRVGDTDHAMGHARRASALAEAAKNPVLSAAALVSVARILGQRSEFTEAEELARKALGLLPLHELTLRAEAHEVRGLCLRHLGKATQALTELNHARRYAQETGNLARQAAVERNLASVYLAASNLEQAETHYRAAFALWQQQGDEPLQAAALNGLGSVESSRGDYAASLSHFQQALQLAQAARTHPHLEAVILWNLAVDLRELRRYDEALIALDEALALAKRASDNWLLSRLYATESDCARASGRLLEAERAGQSALRWARHVKSPEGIGVAQSALGAVALARSENTEAAKQLAAAAKQLRKAKALPALARTLLRQVLVEVDGERDGNADAMAQDLHKLAGEVELGLTLTVEGAEFIEPLTRAVARRVGGDRMQGLLVRAEEWLGRSRPDSPVQLRQQPAPMPRLQAFAFAEARVLKDGALVTSSQWGTAVAREMFFLLLLHPNGLRREQIIEALWPDAPAARATSQFHSTLYRMRHALGLPPLPRVSQRYRLDPMLDIWSDVAEFERAIRTAAGPDTPQEQAVMLLEAATALYHGAFLEDSYSEWVTEPRSKLESRYVRALLALARAYEDRLEHDRSIECYERVLQVDNTLEDVHARVLRCYAERNEPALVREHYQRYAQWLAREVGSAPSPKLARSYRQLVREEA